MEVLNELLGYPKIKIYQDSDLFSFSIDSLLLADFATINQKVNSIVELCSGNGAISFYLTLRTSKQITSIELQKKAFELAIKSNELNGFTNINFINDNLIDINKKIGRQKYDLVIVNPPFFKYQEDSNINKSEFKTIARHEVECNLDDVVKESSILLNNGGYLAMVHRPERLDEIILTLNKYNLSLKRLRFIYPKEGQTCNHILLEAKKTNNTGGVIVLPPLIVHSDNGEWTEEVLEIYNRK
ncbi:MAG: tRNA1(Val) (adenine(37)-N6)-methyltransferase [bacterium]